MEAAQGSTSLYAAHHNDNETTVAMDLQNTNFVPSKSNSFNNPFSTLPCEMVAEIFSYIEPKQRQRLRLVCNRWRNAINFYHGIHLKINNLNWNVVDTCNCAKAMTLCGFSRDVRNPDVITSRLVSLEIKELAAYYSFMPILQNCNLLKSLVINCVTFLQNSLLNEYTSSEYINRTRRWLPSLEYFKFVSCTTQRGVYNHIIPNDLLPDEFYGLENAVRTFDISRGEMEFIPFILQVLIQSKSLANIEMVLTDIWKIPFADLLQVNVDGLPMSLDVSLWHFGSKRLLPVANLLGKLGSLTSLTFTFPHHFDHFYMKFGTLQQQTHTPMPEPYRLEEVIIRQSLRWSQEMRDVDIPWLQILERQFSLRKIEYPFPVLGDDQRMARIIVQNAGTLESVHFVGQREFRDDNELNDLMGERFQPWDSEWFTKCEKLKELELKTHTRFLASVTTSRLIKPNLLPLSLTRFTFHGCIDTGSCPLNVAFSSLINLQIFSHQSRICPWFRVDQVAVAELQVSHVKDILSSMPQLKKWTLEWCDSSSTIMVHLVITSHAQRHSAFVSREVLEWLTNMKGDVDYCEMNTDRQMKSLTLNICERE